MIRQFYFLILFVLGFFCPLYDMFKTNAISKYRMKRFVTSTNSDLEFRKVYIGNLPFNLGEKDLEKLVNEKVGNNLLVSVSLPRGKKSKNGLGYGFVNFKDTLTAQLAAQRLDGIEEYGRVLKSSVTDAKVRVVKPRVDANTVYLYNLEWSLTDLEIKNMCDDIVGEGLVVSIETPADNNTGMKRGFSYVEFIDDASAKKAINDLTGLEVLGRILTCVEFSKSRNR